MSSRDVAAQAELSVPTVMAAHRAYEDRLGVRLPVRIVGKYLKRWGFTP